jgi:hypothetical protein
VPTPFGFYLNPNGPGAATNAPEPELFFSNRLFNDLGPSGAGAIHAPFDGDVQFLVFDISTFTAPYTWLVWSKTWTTAPTLAPAARRPTTTTTTCFRGSGAAALPVTSAHLDDRQAPGSLISPRRRALTGMKNESGPP